MKRRICLALLATLLHSVGNSATATAANCSSGPSNFDVAKVMAAARSPKPGLVLLAAHRGYWREQPENTTQAIGEALKRNIETIEIDVRLANDGSPWLLHDFALDRLTTGNGYLSATNAARLAYVTVRDRQGNPSPVKLQSLDEALHYLGDHLHRDAGIVRGFVLAIDLKSPPSVAKDPNSAKVSGYAALKASWARVVALSPQYADLWPEQDGAVLGNAIVFKIKAKEMPDAETFERDFTPSDRQFLRVEPVLHGDDAGNGNRVIKEYGDKPYVIGFEPSAEFVDQPNTSGWIAELKASGRTVPGFASWYDYPEGVAYSSGGCCLSRNIDPGDPGSPLDYSGNWDFSLQLGANWLTADTAPFLHEYLSTQNMRDLSQIC